MESMYKKVDNETSPKNCLFLDTNLLIPQFKEFSDTIECKICSGIVNDPISCKICDTIFCKNCINDWIARSNRICPNRCNYQEFEIRRSTLNLINKIKIYCLNRESGCKEEIYYEMYEKHMNNCEYACYECLACGFKGNKNVIKMHISKCEKVYKNCVYCCGKYFFNEIEKHYKECQMFEINCVQCNILVKKYNLERHFIHECLEGMIECDYCEIKNFKRKDENLHTKKFCFERFRDKLSSHYSKTNTNLEKLFEENEVLKKQIKEKDNLIDQLKDELIKCRESNPNSFANATSKLFGNIGHKIQDQANNMFKNNINNNNSTNTNSDIFNQKKCSDNSQKECKNQ
jgi:hypothetical protein